MFVHGFHQCNLLLHWFNCRGTSILMIHWLPLPWNRWKSITTECIPSSFTPILLSKPSLAPSTRCPSEFKRTRHLPKTICYSLELNSQSHTLISSIDNSGQQLNVSQMPLSLDIFMVRTLIKPGDFVISGYFGTPHFSVPEIRFTLTKEELLLIVGMVRVIFRVAMGLRYWIDSWCRLHSPEKRQKFQQDPPQPLELTSFQTKRIK